MPGQNIIGVQFRRSGKIYEFDASEHLVRIGDQVVVETERGPSLAEVVRIAFKELQPQIPEELKPILRLATDHDLREAKRLTSDFAESFSQERVKQLDLEMRIIKADVQFGGNKVIIYFSAPGRVDFRELVKELASGLKARVELKQVGARDEAKLTGGLGICGREYCCSSFLREFVPVSIKMAKNQNLALNPSKVSGGCGRLLCCLTYEDEVYSELRQKLLPKKTRVRLPDGGFGDVLRGDILNQKMLIETDRGEQVSIAIAELEVVERGTGVEEDDWGDDLDLGGLVDDVPASKEGSEEKRSRQQRQTPSQTPSPIKPADPQKKKDQGDRGPQQGHKKDFKPRVDRGPQQSGGGRDRGQGDRPSKGQQNQQRNPSDKGGRRDDRNRDEQRSRHNDRDNRNNDSGNKPPKDPKNDQ